MSQHRIYGSEADQQKPLAYVRMFRQSRRRSGGLLAAVVVGALLTAVLGVAWVLVQGGLAGPIH